MASLALRLQHGNLHDPESVADVLGLALCRRAVAIGLMREVEIVRDVAALLESASQQVQVADTDDGRRAAVTLMRVAAEQLRESAHHVAEHDRVLRALRALADSCRQTVASSGSRRELDS